MRLPLAFGFIFFLFVVSPSSAQAQEIPIDEISKYRNQVLSATKDEVKFTNNDSLRKAVISFLNTPGSFHTSLSGIKFIGDLPSPDGAFRMITWNISLTDGTYKYFCFVQMPPEDHNVSNWNELIDHHNSIRRVETRSLKADDWYGALYYTIIPFKSNKTTVYALLGWEGHDKYSNKKLIESMYFNSKNEPVFGKAVFESDRLNKRRIVFEYSKEAYLMLRYVEESKQIIFNRLEPSKPELEGVYSFYQPSLTYDAYEFKKGQWNLVQDINPRNKKNGSTYINPKKAKKPKLK